MGGIGGMLEKNTWKIDQFPHQTAPQTYLLENLFIQVDGVYLNGTSPMTSSNKKQWLGSSMQEDIEIDPKNTGNHVLTKFVVFI